MSKLASVIFFLYRNIVTFFYRIYQLLSKFNDNNGMILASSVSFSVLVSAFPLLLAFLAVAGRFIGQRPDLADTIIKLTNIERLLPGVAGEIKEIFITLSESVGVFQGVSAILLIFFGMAFFYAIETSINQIFGTRVNRGFLKKTAVSFSIMVSSFVLLLGSMAATLFAAIVRDLNIEILGINPLQVPFFWRLFFASAPPLMVMMFLYLIYKYVPVIFVHRRFAAISAVITGIFWEFARRLLSWYISNVNEYNRLYGALGAIVAIFMWVYYSSVIFLIGAQLTEFLQQEAGLGRPPEKN